MVPMGVKPAPQLPNHPGHASHWSEKPGLTCPMRIAVGGFQHETNTFSPVPATLADFEAADAWPGLVAGADLLDAVAGVNLPAAGFIEQAQTDGHEIVPLVW